MVGFVVPVLADNPLAYSCLCPVSLHSLAGTFMRTNTVEICTGTQKYATPPPYKITAHIANKVQVH